MQCFYVFILTLMYCLNLIRMECLKLLCGFKMESSSGSLLYYNKGMKWNYLLEEDLFVFIKYC